MAKSRKRRKRAYIPPPNEIRPEDAPQRVSKTVRTDRGRSGGGRPVRDYPTPSWGRTLKRLPIYFFLIFALQYFIPPEGLRDEATSVRVLTAAGTSAVVTIVFAPFMHLMDKWAYSRWQKHNGGASKTAASS